MNDKGERLVSAKEAAELLDVSEQTVRRWCRKGLCECQRTPGGKLWRVVIRDGKTVLS